MFKEVSESITSRMKRRLVVLSILYLGIAIAELVEFLYTHRINHGLLAAVWLVVAVGWAYRFRDFGEPRQTKLDIEASPKD
jgi:hypothetical protein